MFGLYPDNNSYYHTTSYDPFHAWKYEQEMRRRQQAIAEQRLEHETFLRERRRQQEEALRRNQAKQNTLRHLRQKQQQGYQVVQDWDGQLYLVPPSRRYADRMNDDSSNYDRDTADDSSMNETVEDDQTIQSKNSTNIFTKREVPTSAVVNLDQHQNVPTVVVEDVSDSEEDDEGDISVVLEKTLRNRRPSPGEWLEPVEIMQ